MRFEVYGSFALTEKRRVACGGYIFPSDYYDIPGVAEYRDISMVRPHAGNRLKAYAGRYVELYANGGLAIELLSVIQAIFHHDTHLDLLHFDYKSNRYVKQSVHWKQIPCPPKPDAVFPRIPEIYLSGLTTAYV